MTTGQHRSTERFADRVAAYVAARPTYPPALIDWVLETAKLGPGRVVADIGSGTGISARLLLERGLQVYAVEPNEPMRRAAEDELRAWPGFTSVAGTAEATALPSGLVDACVAAQAFHWFDPPRARAEFLRIGKPGVRAVLLWNNRRSDTPFLAALEHFIEQHAVDYSAVRHQQAVEDGRVERFFAPEKPASARFENVQQVGWEGLRDRIASSSYMPGRNHARHDAMIGELRALYDRWAKNGVVEIIYWAEGYVGVVG